MSVFWSIIFVNICILCRPIGWANVYCHQSTLLLKCCVTPPSALPLCLSFHLFVFKWDCLKTMLVNLVELLFIWHKNNNTCASAEEEELVNFRVEVSVFCVSVNAEIRSVQTMCTFCVSRWECSSCRRCSSCVFMSLLSLFQISKVRVIIIGNSHVMMCVMIFWFLLVNF